MMIIKIIIVASSSNFPQIYQDDDVDFSDDDDVDGDDDDGDDDGDGDDVDGDDGDGDNNDDGDDDGDSDDDPQSPLAACSLSGDSLMDTSSNCNSRRWWVSDTWNIFLVGFGLLEFFGGSFGHLSFGQLSTVCFEPL